MRFRHILFDLDGTLLPMRQEQFVAYYMPLLAGAYEKQKEGVDKKALIAAVWDGYKAMIGNDGSRTNREAFWEHMEGRLPVPQKEAEEIALDFYRDGFNRAKAVTHPSLWAKKAVKAAKENGGKVYLATNPVFPRCATENRIRWAGLDAEDFELITTYETCRYSKPNVEYYRGILSECGLDPEECLMIGNDRKEDLAAGKLGIHTYLVTGCLEHGDAPARGEYEGESLSQLYEDLKGLV